MDASENVGQDPPKRDTKYLDSIHTRTLDIMEVS